MAVKALDYFTKENKKNKVATINKTLEYLPLRRPISMEFVPTVKIKIYNGVIIPKHAT
jgi:hypothetical protein